AEVIFFGAGKANNIASGSLFDLDLLEPFVSEKRSHVPAFATAVAVKADHRIPHGNAPAHDSPERDPSEIIAVIEIRNEHLEKWFVGGFRRRDVLDDGLEEGRHVVAFLSNLACGKPVFGAGVN